MEPLPFASLTTVQTAALTMLWLLGKATFTTLRTLLSKHPAVGSHGVSTLPDVLTEMANSGLIRVFGNAGYKSFRLSGQVGYSYLRLLAGRKDFQACLELVRQERPITEANGGKDGNGSELEGTNPLERELSVAVVIGSIAEYSKALAALDGRSSEERQGAEAAVWARLRNSENDCPEELPDAFLPHVLRYWLPCLFSPGYPGTALSMRVLADLPPFLDDLEAVAALAGHFLWRGDRANLELMATTAAEGNSRDIANASLYFLDGKPHEVERCIRGPLAALRQELGDKKAFWCGPFGLAHILSAIKMELPFRQISRLLSGYKDAHRRNLFPDVAPALQALSRLDRLHNHDDERREAPSMDANKRGLLTVLAMAQLAFHVERWDTGGHFDIQEFVKGGMLADAGGYRLAALHLFAAAAHLKILDAKGTERLGQLKEELEVEPLWQPYVKVEPWAKTLVALRRLAVLPEREKPMVFWCLELSEPAEGCYVVKGLTPMLRRLADGGWSKSRPIELAHLLSERHDPFLSPEDLLLKASLVEHHGYSNHRCDCTSTALPHLVGHPRLVMECDGVEQPVSIVAGECRLCVEKCPGGWLVSLPFPALDISKHSHVMVKEADGLYKLHQFSSKLKRVAELFPEDESGRRELFIPGDGEKELGETLASLTGVVGVAGDLMDSGMEGVRQVQGQVKLMIRVALFEDVLGLALLNKALGESPLTVIPAVGYRRILFDTGTEKLSVIRDLDGEAAARDALLVACPSLAKWKTLDNRWRVEGLPDVLLALSELGGAAELVQLVWHHRQPYHVPLATDISDFKLTMKSNANKWLAVEGEATFDEGMVAKLSTLVLNLPRAIGEFIPLDERHFLRITAKLRRQLEVLSAVATHGEGGLGVAPGALPLLQNVIPPDVQKACGEAWHAQVEAFERAMELKPIVPKGLKGKLRPYQEEGFAWLSKLYECGAGACLADDMGVGKTIQLLALLLDRAAAGPSLVVAPASVCRNWVREAGSFTPGLAFKTLDNDGREDLVASLKDHDVLVCSYGVLFSEEGLFTDKTWNCVVLDEAQAIKNHKSMRAKSVKKLNARFRVAATGTPVENNLGDLWSLFDFINPGLLGTQAHFQKRFMGDTTLVPNLKRLVSPFILRRLKSQVLGDLPPKTETVLPVTLVGEERAFYEVLRREALAGLEASRDVNKCIILAMLMKLRCACCHPSLVAPKMASIPGAKMELLMEQVEKLRAGGHRALIFSQFVAFLKIVGERFDAQGISYQYLDGSTPESKRQDIVDAFQHGEDGFFLISMRAGGVGLNLTAANYVIILDPWWNPAVENQAADRAHRIGQKRPVTVYRLVTEGTVEMRIMELHKCKRKLVEKLLDNTDRTQLSRDELLALLK